jgi:hypothetical protein
VFTTAHGLLQMRETGMSSRRTGNPAGSVLTSWGDGLAGTGAYEGVTGDLFFFGKVEDDGRFLVKVRGKICRP